MGKKKKQSKSSRKTKQQSTRKTATKLSTERPNSAANFSDDQIESFLKTGEHQGLLEAYFGEELYREFQELSRNTRSASRRGGQRVLILPGILGSKLGTKGRIFDDTIWLDPVDAMLGNLLKLKMSSNSKITSLGVMLHAYLPAKLRLWYAGFDAEFHHYDWRQSIDKLGRDLANKIIKETGGSNTSRPGSISIVAHSMGGLVSRRALQILSEKTESDGETPMLDRVNRLVMQGTPNFGSFAPAMVVQGVYPTIKKVAALDLYHTVEELSEKLFSGPVSYTHLTLPTKA